MRNNIPVYSMFSPEIVMWIRKQAKDNHTTTSDIIRKIITDHYNSVKK